MVGGAGVSGAGGDVTITGGSSHVADFVDDKSSAVGGSVLVMSGKGSQQSASGDLLLASADGASSGDLLIVLNLNRVSQW